MPRRAPRSRHRSAKLSARRLLTPQWAGLVDQAVAASGAPPPAYGLGVTAPLPARAGSPALSSEAPSVSSIDASPPPHDDAPPERLGGAARREEDGGGRPPRAQQAFHASADIVKGGESFAENSDPWVASDRGRQQSYPVSRPLAHRLHSSYQASFEAALMSCRVVGRLRWVGGRHGDAERGATRRGRQAEPRQGRPLSPRPTGVAAALLDRRRTHAPPRRDHGTRRARSVR